MYPIQQVEEDGVVPIELHDMSVQHEVKAKKLKFESQNGHLILSKWKANTIVRAARLSTNTLSTILTNSSNELNLVLKPIKTSTNYSTRIAK